MRGRMFYALLRVLRRSQLPATVRAAWVLIEDSTEMPWPTVIRMVPAEKLEGDYGEARDRRFLGWRWREIWLNREVEKSLFEEMIVHEAAHAAVSDMEEEGHGAAWGVFYARFYSLVLE